MTDFQASRKAILFYGGFASRTGGAFMHVTSLSQGLLAKGWSVETVTLDRLPVIFRYLPHIVEKIINYFSAPLGFYYKGILTGALYKIFIKRSPSDFLLFEDIYLGWNSPNPTVSVLHAVWSDNLQAYKLEDQAINRLKLKEISRINNIFHPVITVSHRYKKFIERDHFGHLGNVSLEVVELGLDTQNIKNIEKDIQPKNTRSLIYCGTLEARKNVHFMLQVFRAISLEDPLASLTVVGDGPDLHQLERYAKDNSLNVKFLGRLPHSQVLDELKKHNIYIHTALKESFSFALLEAKLSGLTTCALNSLEVPEEFIDVGFEKFDVADWSSKILMINGKPDMSSFPDYSIERMTEHTLSLVSLR